MALSIAAIGLPPVHSGPLSGQAAGDGAARGAQARLPRPDDAGRTAGTRPAGGEADLAEGERRGAPTMPPAAAWLQRRHGPSALLAAMIENMGGAATSAYKGMYVDVRV